MVRKAFFSPCSLSCRAKIRPVLVNITPTATMTVATTTKAETVGKAAAIADARLPRSNVHFNFAVSGPAPMGQHHEAFWRCLWNWRFPVVSKKPSFDQRVHHHLDASCSEGETDAPLVKLPAISPACADKTNRRQSLVSADRAIADRGTMARMLVP